MTTDKLNEEAVIACDSTNWLRDVYDEAPCGYLTLDKHGIIIEVNNTLLKWLGRTREEVLGQLRFDQLLEPAHCATFERSYKLFQGDSSLRDLQLQLRTSGNEALNVAVTASKTRGEDGQVMLSRWTLFECNGSSVKEKQRADLVSNFAHDLKNQLLGTKRIVEFLLARDLGALEPEQVEVLQLIEEGSEEQLRILQSLLDLYRYDAGTQSLRLELLSLESVAAEALTIVKSHVTKCGTASGIVIEMEKSIDCAGSDTSVGDDRVRADRSAIRHVMVNLLQNAVRFARPGSRVSLGVKCTAGSVKLLLTDETGGEVGDNGKCGDNAGGNGNGSVKAGNIGVSSSTNLNRVGSRALPESFWEGEIGKRFLGSGGFAFFLCRRILELHQGQIECVGHAGKGTTISVSLPRPARLEPSQK